MQFNLINITVHSPTKLYVDLFLCFRSSIRGSRRLQNLSSSNGHRSSFVRRPWNQAVMEAASRAQASSKNQTSSDATQATTNDNQHNQGRIISDKILLIVTNDIISQKWHNTS